jgi:hypothetical protein
MQKEHLSTSTTFYPCWFSLDYTFNAGSPSFMVHECRVQIRGISPQSKANQHVSSSGVRCRLEYLRKKKYTDTKSVSKLSLCRQFWPG